MPQTTQSVLRISGPPGVTFRLVPRARGDEIVKDAATGALNAAGSAQLNLPRGSYVLLAEDHAAVPVHINGDSEVKNVELLPDR